MNWANIKTNLFAVLFLMLRRWQFECPTALVAKKPSKQGGRVTNFSIHYSILSSREFGFFGSWILHGEGSLLHSLPLVAPKVDQWQRAMQLKEVSKDTATCNAVLQLQWKKGIRWVHNNVLFFQGMWHPRKKERYRTSTMRFFLIELGWCSHMFLILRPLLRSICYIFSHLLTISGLLST